MGDGWHTIAEDLEFDFIENIAETWASAQQTLATGGGAIVLSTPYGTGNWFHKTWVDAEADGEFNPIRLHWTVHPEWDQSWRDLQTELLGEKSAAQECDCDFISSGHTVVDGPIIQWYEQTFIEDPKEKRGFDSNYWIWEYPNYSTSYVVVADVARGDGADYSAFHVLDIKNSSFENWHLNFYAMHLPYLFNAYGLKVEYYFDELTFLAHYAMSEEKQKEIRSFYPCNVDQMQNMKE